MAEDNCYSTTLTCQKYINAAHAFLCSADQAFSEINVHSALTCNNRSYPEKASKTSMMSHRDTHVLDRGSPLHHADSDSRAIPCSAILGVVTVQTSQCNTTSYVFTCAQTRRYGKLGRRPQVPGIMLFNCATMSFMHKRFSSNLPQTLPCSRQSESFPAMCTGILISADLCLSAFESIG